MNPNEVAYKLEEMKKRIHLMQNELENLGVQVSVNSSIPIPTSIQSIPVSIEVSQFKDKIYYKLAEIKEYIADAYLQVRVELVDVNRVSWIGTAHGIRQVLSWILLELAPDDELNAQPDFKGDNQGKPTQKQRVAYILRKQGSASNKVQETLKEIEQIDERIGTLTRTMYDRASDAAHRAKDKDEVKRIMRYFDAFVYDLLDIKD